MVPSSWPNHQSPFRDTQLGCPFLFQPLFLLLYRMIFYVPHRMIMRKQRTSKLCLQQLHFAQYKEFEQKFSVENKGIYKPKINSHPLVQQFQPFRSDPKLDLPLFLKESTCQSQTFSSHPSRKSTRDLLLQQHVFWLYRNLL